jgi:hypothetical protein
MKCVSCETEINPKWKHAIDINVCPFCGKHIMEEHLKNCLAGLAAAMEDMQKYPEQLKDWMLSNHQFIKTDSPDLPFYVPKDTIKEMRRELDEAEFQEKKTITVKIKNALGEEEETEVETRRVQSDDRTQGFFDRAEVGGGVGKSGSNSSNKGKGEPKAPKSVVQRTEHLKGVVEEIRKEVKQGFVRESGLASMIDPEGSTGGEGPSAAELEAILDGGDIIASGLPSHSSGDEEEIPSVVMRMASSAANRQQNNGSNVNEKDLRTLREMQYKAATGANRLASGKGKFSRSE